MKIINYIKDTKSQYWKRDLNSKIPIDDDFIYKCYRLTMWYRYKEYAFRYEEVYFYLGLRKNILQKDYEEIVKDIKEKVGERNFIQILIDTEQWYKNEENMSDFYEWIRKQ